MSEAAGLIITNAKVITMDRENPYAEAVVVDGNRIAFVGSAAEAESWRGPTTQVIDGQGCTLLPGFIDSHFHLDLGSILMGSIRLDEFESLEELTIGVKYFAQEHPDDPWVMGTHLKEDILPEGQRLTRNHLDAMVSDRPLALIAHDHHTVWVNTRALEIANVLEGADLGSEGEIVMGEDGLASGELREMGAYAKVLAFSDSFGAFFQMMAGAEFAGDHPIFDKLRAGIKQAVQSGITSVHNMSGNAAQMALYDTLEAAGELLLRIYVPYLVVPGTPLEALQEAAAMREEHQGDMVCGGAVKYITDGVMSSRTAFLVGEYADLPGERGYTQFSLQEYTRMVIESDRLGLQVFAHTIGDGAVRLALDAFEAARRTNGPRDSRHRIEHVELIQPDDIHRCAELGVIASMQPLHEAESTPKGDPYWGERIGRENWERAFAWQTLREAGVRLIFGSDWPVVTQNPILGIHTAVNRKPWAPGLPHQHQTLEDAIIAYTRDAAYAEFQEHNKGQLRPGMLADMVLLSADLASLPPDEIKTVRPVVTICDGRITYECLTSCAR